ncbi:MAG TPA: hypothetical protein DCM07_16275 [Planctomycetaceae bacterium]|nr:hypothetical protein [Gimesia sp.]HAH46374.1 hypothetical protein [Planctomycetaceae bacterium]HBL48540.1 hypothetical protein [Planctomycetaceae bacterium]
MSSRRYSRKDGSDKVIIRAVPYRISEPEFILKQNRESKRILANSESASLLTIAFLNLKYSALMALKTVQ